MKNQLGDKRMRIIRNELDKVKKKVVALDRLLEKQEDSDIFELMPDLIELSVTIAQKIAQCKQLYVETSESLKGVIGTPDNPIPLGGSLEGFKFGGEWTYRDTDPLHMLHRQGWMVETNETNNKEFDYAYVELETVKRRNLR